MAGSASENLIEAVAQLFQDSLPLDQTFEGFCVLLGQVVPAPIVILMVRDGDTLRVEEYYRQDTLLKPDRSLLPHDSISVLVMQSLQSRIFLRDEDWPEGTQQFTFGGEGVRTNSAIFVPLRGEGAGIGVLTVQTFVPGAYGASDVELLEHCARYFAERLRGENAQRAGW